MNRFIPAFLKLRVRSDGGGFLIQPLTHHSHLLSLGGCFPQHSSGEKSSLIPKLRFPQTN